MEAWVVIWEWDGESARVEDRYVGIYNARKSHQEIKEFIEMLYMSQSYSLRDMARISDDTRPDDNPMIASYPFKGTHNIICCGRNPRLVALLVKNLKVQVGFTGLCHPIYDWPPQIKHLTDNYDSSVNSQNNHIE
jgi:hypothetical protein